MSKILLYYPVTESVYLDYLVSQEWQQAIYGGMYQFDKLIITDTEFIKKDPDKKETILRIPEWTLCSASNVAIDFAKSNGYDYIWLLDSGAIILSDPILPVTHLTAAIVYMTTPEELYKRSFGENASQWKVSSWYLMDRHCMDCKFSEEFSGLHYTDFDYVYNVLKPAGIGADGDTPNKCIHVYHELRASRESCLDAGKTFVKRTLKIHGDVQGIRFIESLDGGKSLLSTVL